MTETGLKVGELADRSGVTVRTLHHYDRIGLLRPTSHTDAGHRLYDTADVARLYRILALRGLGFALGEIGTMLDSGAQEDGGHCDLDGLVRRHLDELGRSIDLATRLRTHLRALDARLGTDAHPRIDDLLTVLEEMTMLDIPIRSTTSLLVYDDLPAAHAYLAGTFGLTPGELEFDGAGRAVHGELIAGDHMIWLHPSGDEYRSPRSLGGVSSMTVIAVDDADVHHAYATEHGADILSAPRDQPYGVREYGARDPEGHLWYFHAPLT